MQRWFKNLLSAKTLPPDRHGAEILTEGLLPPSEDTFAAINELSRVVKNNPDAVEIYLALGNLYRSQGEIERAVHIRQNLILRPGLHAEFKARALYELGRDYKRGGFVDRAFEAFQQARAISGNNPAINQELAKLCADAEDFLLAAKYYVELGNNIAEAHYLVRQAQKESRDGSRSAQPQKWIDRALKVSPGSMEAWLEKLYRNWNGLEKGVPSKILEQAMRQVPDQMRFILLEGLLTTVRTASSSFFSEDEVQHNLDGVLLILADYSRDMLLQYYGGLLLLEQGQHSEAQLWFEKCLLLETNFWLARLELLALARQSQTLPKSLEVQLDFFINRAREVKKFICRQCGLKRESVFFVCPRCGSWHTISFRRNLNE